MKFKTTTTKNNTRRILFLVSATLILSHINYPLNNTQNNICTNAFTTDQIYDMNFATLYQYLLYCLTSDLT